MLINMKTSDSPIDTANDFAKEATAEGFSFDFSLSSLEVEIDKYLAKYYPLNQETKLRVECVLTAYIGETIRRLYQGEWTGEYSLSSPGLNFYTCRVKIGKFDFYPNHFIGYYLSNSKKSEGTFYDYLHKRDYSQGIFHDFLGGGLLNIITKEK
ncbi:hypothetical protein BH10BAC4_BH10BAC4_25740 [soil metagenome]